MQTCPPRRSLPPSETNHVTDQSPSTCPDFYSSLYWMRSPTQNFQLFCTGPDTLDAGPCCLYLQTPAEVGRPFLPLPVRSLRGFVLYCTKPLHSHTSLSHTEWVIWPKIGFLELATCGRQCTRLSPVPPALSLSLDSLFRSQYAWPTKGYKWCPVFDWLHLSLLEIFSVHFILKIALLFWNYSTLTFAIPHLCLLGKSTKKGSLRVQSSYPLTLHFLPLRLWEACVYEVLLSTRHHRLEPTRSA